MSTMHALLETGWPELLARLATGALLLTAGASKGRRAGWLESLAAGLRVPQPFRRPAEVLVPVLETGLGAALLLGFGLWLAGMGAAMLMLLFAAALALAAR